MADENAYEPARPSPEARALEALALAGIDVDSLAGRSRRSLARRLRSVIAALPSQDGPNRATVRDLLALADYLDGPSS
jgi:hypothetical protein